MTIYKYGVDISEWEGADFDVAPYGFVAIRCAYGTTPDPLYETFVEKCEEHGIPYMFYLYSYALNDTQAAEEAETAISIAKQHNPFLVAYDMEDSDGWKAEHGALNHEDCTSFCEIFCNRVKAAGFNECIYTNPDFLDNYVTPTHPLWLADWGVPVGDISGAGIYQDLVIMHQYQGSPIDRDALLVPLSRFTKKKSSNTPHRDGHKAAPKRAHKPKSNPKPNSKPNPNPRRIPAGFIPQDGTFTLEVNELYVRDQPNVYTGRIMAEYHYGESINYDCYKAIPDGYCWISYISYYGYREYVVCGLCDSEGYNTDPFGYFE